MTRTWRTAGLLVAIGLAGCRGAGGPEADRLTAPQVADVQVALGKTLESRGEADAARGYYAEAARKNPKRADAWARQAVLADKEGKFDESWPLHRRAIDLDPTNPDLFCNYGYSLYLQERWAEAEDALRRAITLKADHRRAHNNLGLVLARTGRPDEALECFGRAGCPKDEGHTNLAYALSVAGDFPAARANYEAALRLQPASAAARRGLDQLVAVERRVGPQARPADGVVPAAAQVPAVGATR